MSEVTRYEYDGGHGGSQEMRLFPDGGWVRAADYDALLARAKNAEADFLAAAECNVEQRKTIQRLQTELATEHLLADAAVDDANDAERRVAELEGLLRECRPIVQGYCDSKLTARIEAALAPAAAVVMPERMTTIPEGKTISYAAGYEAALDAVANLNRNTVPLELLGRISQWPCADHTNAIDELRAILAAAHPPSRGSPVMSKADRFWSHEAQNIRCVRESDYDRDVNAWQERALTAEAKQAQQGEPHNCERDGHLPIGWGGPVFCELCSARLPDEPELDKAEQPAAGDELEAYPHDHPLHKVVFMALSSYRGDATFEDGVQGLIEELKEARAALAPAALVPSVPEGYVLVPIKPTDAMRDAGNIYVLNRGTLMRIWADMLAAAQQPTEGSTND